MLGAIRSLRTTLGPSLPRTILASKVQTSRLAKSSTDSSNNADKGDEAKEDASTSKSPNMEDMLTQLYENRARMRASQTIRFDSYVDEDAKIIYDVDEEMAIRRQNREKMAKDTTQIAEHELDIDLRRGEHGVFDVAQLVSLLREEHCRDLMTIRVPPTLQYVDHMILANCVNERRLKRVAEFVIKVFKMKMNESERGNVPKVEGSDDKHPDWLAIDLGNIALHLFLEEARNHYDLESLWLLGSDFDIKTREDSMGNPIREYCDDNPEVLGDRLANFSPLKHS